MNKPQRADISQAALDRLVDVFIEFVRENMRLKERTPFAWCWYDSMDERWEFVLRREDVPKDAQSVCPVYR